MGHVGFDDVAVNERALGRSEVFDQQAARFDQHAGVAAGDGEIIDDDAVAFGAANDQRRKVKWEFATATVGPGDLKGAEFHCVSRQAVPRPPHGPAGE